MFICTFQKVVSKAKARYGLQKKILKNNAKLFLDQRIHLLKKKKNAALTCNPGDVAITVRGRSMLLFWGSFPNCFPDRPHQRTPEEILFCRIKVKSTIRSLKKIKIKFEVIN